MPRPISATIHTAALRHNLQRARDCAPDARVWAVVKANAYGHGIENAFEALRGADGFALLDLNEAERIRALGWRGPVLLLEGVFEPRDLELCSRLGLWHAVHCAEQIDWLAAHKTLRPHRVFLKMNSGMNRLGFAAQALPSGEPQATTSRPQFTSPACFSAASIAASVEASSVAISGRRTVRFMPRVRLSAYFAPQRPGSRKIALCSGIRRSW